jgi:hypothetical protein
MTRNIDLTDLVQPSHKINNKQEENQTLGMRENLISKCACYIILNVQLPTKITSYANKQESMTLTQEKKQSIKIVHEEPQMLDLKDKKFK